MYNIQQRTTQHIVSIFCVSQNTKKIQVQVYNKTTNTKLKIATHVRYTTSHVDMSWIVTRTETIWLHTHYGILPNIQMRQKNIIDLFAHLCKIYFYWCFVWYLVCNFWMSRHYLFILIIRNVLLEQWWSFRLWGGFTQNKTESIICLSCNTLCWLFIHK